MHQSKTPAPTTLPVAVDYRGASEILSIPEGTLRSLVARRQIPHVRLSSRTVRFRVEDLHRWLAEHAVSVTLIEGV